MKSKCGEIDPQVGTLKWKLKHLVEALSKYSPKLFTLTRSAHRYPVAISSISSTSKNENAHSQNLYPVQRTAPYP